MTNSNQGSLGTKPEESGTSSRGFASVDKDRQREIGAHGDRAAHSSGNAHEFDSKEAREAARIATTTPGSPAPRVVLQQRTASLIAAVVARRVAARNSTLKPGSKATKNPDPCTNGAAVAAPPFTGDSTHQNQHEQTTFVDMPIFLRSHRCLDVPSFRICGTRRTSCLRGKK